MKGWSKAPTQIGVGMIGVGFLLIVLAWNGAASLDYTQGQIPYLISGGVGGLGLVVGGVGLLVIQGLRRDNLMLAAKVDELIDVMAGASLGGPTAVPTGSDMVVAGRTTYHTGECHLVEGRTDLQVMSPADAKSRGLAPCRICEPAAKAG